MSNSTPDARDASAIVTDAGTGVEPGGNGSGSANPPADGGTAIPELCEGVTDDLKPSEVPAPEEVPPYGLIVGEELRCPDGSSGGYWTLGENFCAPNNTCLVPCQTAFDCPDPGSGNAELVCQEAAHCILRCDNGETCPDGMQCVLSGGENPEQQKECAWLTEESEAAFDCWYEASACGVLTTQETCEERINGSAIQLTQGCIWVTETVMSLGNETCMGTTTEHCAIGHACGDDQCGIGTAARCNGCESLVYVLEDDDEGTTTLVQTDFKGYRPEYASTTGRPLEPCEFDESSANPSVCECACP